MGLEWCCCDLVCGLCFVVDLPVVGVSGFWVLFCVCELLMFDVWVIMLGL